jgi:hypothetical protein
MGAGNNTFGVGHGTVTPGGYTAGPGAPESTRTAVDRIPTLAMPGLSASAMAAAAAAAANRVRTRTPGRQTLLGNTAPATTKKKTLIGGSY